MSSHRATFAAALTVLIGAGTWYDVRAQAQVSVADGPWSGQMQCVLSVRGSDYQDDLTHTWRITGGPPEIVGMFRKWPAVWSVQGSGSRQLAQRRRDADGRERDDHPLVDSI